MPPRSCCVVNAFRHLYSIVTGSLVHQSIQTLFLSSPCEYDVIRTTVGAAKNEFNEVTISQHTRMFRGQEKVNKRENCGMYHVANVLPYSAITKVK